MWMLLHGFTGSPRSWDRVVAKLPADEPPLRPALVGHGPAWIRDRVESFDREIDRLAELAETMPLPRYLCGYSMGARLALALAVLGRPRFEGIVLVGVHPGIRDPEDRAQRRLADAERAARIRAEGTVRFVDHWESNPLFASQAKLPPEVLAEQRAVRISHDPEGLATALEVAGLGAMPCFAPRVPGLDPAPVWVAGSRDAKFTGIARGVTEVPRIVEGAGHNVVLERPDAIVSIMRIVEHAAHD